MSTPIALFSFERYALKAGRQTKILRPFLSNEQTFVLGTKVSFITEDGTGPVITAMVSSLDIVDYRTIDDTLAEECGFRTTKEKSASAKLQTWFGEAYQGLISAMVVIYKLERE